MEVLTIATFYHSCLTVCSRRSMNSHRVTNFCFVFTKNLAVNPFGLGLILSNIGHSFTKLKFSSIFISSTAYKYTILCFLNGAEPVGKTNQRKNQPLPAVG